MIKLRFIFKQNLLNFGFKKGIYYKLTIISWFMFEYKNLKTKITDIVFNRWTLKSVLQKQNILTFLD